MNRETRILQQRVQVPTIGRCRDESQERIRRRQREQQEADADEPEHSEYTRSEARRQLARAEGDGDRPDAQQENPEQQRAFMRTPHGGHSINHRQRGVRVLRDVEHREVEIHERRDETAERRRDHHELTGDGWRDGSDPTIAAERGTGDAEERLQPCEQQREDQRELTNFGKHQMPAGFSTGACC